MLAATKNNIITANEPGHCSVLIDTPVFIDITFILRQDAYSVVYLGYVLLARKHATTKCILLEYTVLVLRSDQARSTTGTSLTAK